MASQWGNNCPLGLPVSLPIKTSYLAGYSGTLLAPPKMWSIGKIHQEWGWWPTEIDNKSVIIYTEKHHFHGISWVYPGQRLEITVVAIPRHGPSIPNPGSLLRDSVCQDVMGLGFPLSLAMLFLVLYFWPIGFCWLHWFDCTHLFIYSAQKYLFTLPPPLGNTWSRFNPRPSLTLRDQLAAFIPTGPLGISLSG